MALGQVIQNKYTKIWKAYKISAVQERGRLDLQYSLFALTK